MGRVRVSVIIDASPAEVWDEVRHVERHVSWMADAAVIRFTTARVEGMGTAFECDTRVGPFRLTDHMEITEWRRARSMGVRHTGIVRGEGRFTLRPVRRAGRPVRTRFTWSERLVFPWWLGGPFGGIVGVRVMKRIWRRNLRSLKRIVEA